MRLEAAHSAFVSALIFLFNSASIFSATTTGRFFSSNMVLQRDKPVRVWGWDSNGQKVTVTFAGQSKEATTANGRWQVELDAMPANKTGQNLVIKGSSTLTYSNVVVGDVWFCTGQSNMELLPKANKGDPAPDNETKPLIRMFRLKQKTSAPSKNPSPSNWPAPRSDIDRYGNWLEGKAYQSKEWISPTKDAIAVFSVIASYFGRDLHDKLDIPIGLIDASYGGTPLESWLVGGDCYNGCIYPFTGLSIAGFTWWQGEGNCYGNQETYCERFVKMITDWRASWNFGDIPFLTITLQAGVCGKAWIIRNGHFCSLQLPKTGLVVATDLCSGLHPRGCRQATANRLANMALAIVNGKKIVYSGPTYRGHEQNGNSLKVLFNHVGSGLEFVNKQMPLTPTDEGKPWEISANGKSWIKADATIEGDAVVITAAGVANPAHIRYGNVRTPSLTLYNKEGLPAAPFNSTVHGSSDVVKAIDMPPVSAAQAQSSILCRRAGQTIKIKNMPAADKFVTIHIHDLQGKKLLSLNSENLGACSLTMHISGIASGKAVILSVKGKSVCESFFLLPYLIKRLISSIEVLYKSPQHPAQSMNALSVLF